MSKRPNEEQISARQSASGMAPEGSQLAATNSTRLTLDGSADSAKAQLCLSPESELPSLANECVIYRSGATIDVAWTPWRFAEVCWLMLNDNDPRFFLQVWQDAKGKEQFKKNKSARADKRAEWAWNCITGKSKQKVGLGYYPTNIYSKSRWGAMDFDCHGGSADEAASARQRAMAAFELVSCHTSHILLLGTSGSLGWHLFIYADGFYPIEEWIRFLEEVARKIGVPVVDGTCEIFPSSTRGRHGGGGIRAPGTVNPKTGEYGRIYFDQVTPVLKEPSAQAGRGGALSEEKGLSLFCISQLTREENAQLTDKGQKEVVSQLEARYRIHGARQRHARLQSLIGESFRCYGHDLLKEAAERQHKFAAVTPNASLDEHIDEFDKFWTFFHDLWCEELSDPEREKLAQLQTQNEVDGFRIIRGWAKLQGVAPDFAVSSGNLALRLGLTFGGACKMRAKFASLGIIHETAKFVANTSAARFQWLLHANTSARQNAMRS